MTLSGQAASGAAYDIVPEVAAGYPQSVSDDYKTFTFTAPARTSASATGVPCGRAPSLMRSTERLRPTSSHPARCSRADIVGAADVLAGRRKTAAGVVARGNTLIVRFTRPAPDFVARTTLPFFCAVPPRPAVRPRRRRCVSRGGARTTRSSTGPANGWSSAATASTAARGPRHVDGFDVDLRAPTPARHDPPRRPQRGRLGSHGRRRLHGSHAGLGGEVRREPDAILRQAGADRSHARPSTRRGTLFRNNPRSPAGGQLRTRPAGAAGDRRRPDHEHAHRPVPSARDPRLPRTPPSIHCARPDLRRARALARGKLRRREGDASTRPRPRFADADGSAREGATRQDRARSGGAAASRSTSRRSPTSTGSRRGARSGTSRCVLWHARASRTRTRYINLLLETPIHRRCEPSPASGRRTWRRADGARGTRARRAAIAGAPTGRSTSGSRAKQHRSPPISVLREVTLVSDRVGCVTLRPMLDLVTVSASRSRHAPLRRLDRDPDRLRADRDP